MQGRLRNESLTIDVQTECACCARSIRFRLTQYLLYDPADPQCRPLVFFPIVDFTRLKAPSIVDDF